VITVARLGVAPVKGLRLEEPAAVLLERDGVARNRRFHLIDDQGRLVNGRGAGPLAVVEADCDDDGSWLELRFPDGTRLREDIRLGERVETDFWGRPVPGHLCTGPWAAALSARAGRSLRLVRVERTGDGSDFHRASIVSTASLEELARRSGVPATADPRRFRMLLVLDGCAPHEEDGWESRRLRVGEAVIRVGGPVPRCVVTTLHPETGVRDADTLRAIRNVRGVSERRTLDFGVYAEVEEPGRVRVGDRVQPAPDGPPD
jgi:uncharacterized protein YcbX